MLSNYLTKNIACSDWAYVIRPYGSLPNKNSAIFQFSLMFSPHHRRSIRLAGCDYGVPGFYFVTICTKNRECLFGEIVDFEMRLNELGDIVKEEWERTPQIRPNIIIDTFVVMPNHCHAIIGLVKQFDAVGAYCNTPLPPTTRVGPYAARPFISPTQSIDAIVRGFKGAVTKQINIVRTTPTNPVWQRNYYEHIIRTDESLETIRLYIKNNPAKWQEDRENPINWK